MIDFILDVMEEIVETIFRAADNMLVFSKNLACIVGFLLIMATAPVWIVPFMIWRSRKKDDNDDQDDNYDGDYDYYMSLTR